MQIKFTKLEKVFGERKDSSVWTAYKVHGTKLEDNTPWKSTNVFDQDDNKDIIEKMQALEPGDKIDVVHVKNGRNWTITDIKAVTSDPSGPASTGGNTSGGGSKWAKDPNKNRSVCLSYALEFGIPTLFTPAALADMEFDEYLKHAFTLANQMVLFVEGKVPSGSSNTVSADDALEPPTV